MSLLVRLLVSGPLLTAVAVPVSAQVTTGAKRLSVVRTSCVLIPHNEPLRVPKGEVCGCVKEADGAIGECARPQDELTRLVDHDTTEHLIAYLELLATKAGIATAKPHIRFVWAGPNADGKRVARSVLHHYGEKTLTTVLPGVTAAATDPKEPLSGWTYVDLLVGIDRGKEKPTDDNALPELQSLYTSGEKPNPILEQIPSFIKQLALLEGIAAGLGPSTIKFTPQSVPPGVPVPPPPPPPVRTPEAVFKVYGPALPHGRADVAVRDWIIIGPTADGLKGASTELRDALLVGRARTSACARSLATGYDQAVSRQAVDCLRRVDGPSKGPFSAEAARCRSILDDVFDEVYKTTLADPALCRAETTFSGTDPVAQVDEAYRALATGLGASVTQGETALKNVPREAISFGLMTAVRFGDITSPRPRVKLNDDGVVVDDPMPRLVTAVLVNWHPFGYDPSKINTAGDKGSFKLSAGTTVTPDFGFVGAAGYSPIKGLTVHVGYAVLYGNSPKQGITVGEKVPDDFYNKNDPFRAAPMRTWLWGLSYSFQ